MIKKRGQGAIEFAVLFGFVLLFFVIFFSIIQGNQIQKNKEKEKFLLQNTALEIQEEINIASESSDGYLRNFTTPSNILGEEYSIIILETNIYVNTSNNFVSYRIANFTGIINKGMNTIKKENGIIKINLE